MKTIIKNTNNFDWTNPVECKKHNVDFKQYLLEGETIFEYSVGLLRDVGFSKYYKDMLVLNKIPDQRKQFEANMQTYLNIGMNNLKSKGII